MNLFGTALTLDQIKAPNCPSIHRALRSGQPQVVRQASDMLWPEHSALMVVPLEHQRERFGAIIFSSLQPSYTLDDVRIGYLLYWLQWKCSCTYNCVKRKSKGSINLIGMSRIGIHSGPVMAGVIGRKKFSYDVWGDTVNTVARMESSGVAGRINISRETADLIQDFFKMEYRGKINAKNKGSLDMFLVTRICEGLSLDPEGILPN